MILALSYSVWAQSLGDVARASREHTKSAKVITDDDVKTEGPSDAPASNSGDLTQEVDHMRKIFRQICADPRTDHGRKLSDDDKRDMNEAVKPLRVRVNQFEQTQQHYKDALADIDKKYEAKFKEIWPTTRPATDDDIEKGKALKQQYELEKASLLKQGDGELLPYQSLMKQLESVGRECPAAAKTITD